MKRIMSLVLSVILLLVLNGCGGRNGSPTARIVEPTNNTRTNDLTVTFKATSSDPEDKIESAIWSFGDGAQQVAGDEVTHTYAQGGDYTVHYTVTDDRGESATAAVRVSINQAPQAAARVQVRVDGQVLPAVKSISGEVPLEVRFEGVASKDLDGEIINYYWDFGDGATSDEIDPVHTYQTLGEYVAVLTVTDNEGAEAQDKVILDITPKPEVITDFIESSTTVPEYSVISGFTLSGQESNKTMLYRYRMVGDGPYTKEQIKLALLDAVLNRGRYPEIRRLTIYLFSDSKQGFMDPGDYDHYLGMVEWERPESDSDSASLAYHIINNANLSYNDKYLDGSAPTVVGFELHEAELDADDPRCIICDTSRVVYVTLILNPKPKDVSEESSNSQVAPLCRQQAEATIQAVLQRALMAPGGYGLNIYDGVTAAMGIAVGLWGSRVDVNDLLSPGLLFEDPETWDIDTDNFKLVFTKELPDCDA